jgi:hypothetical protein
MLLAHGSLIPHLHAGDVGVFIVGVVLAMFVCVVALYKCGRKG